MKIIEIGHRKIGPGYPCFIIAEAGVNHNGQFQLAKQLVDAATAAGVDAIKFQTFKADCVASVVAPKAEYQQKGTPTDESQLEMIRRLELSEDTFSEIYRLCRSRGILFLSTPFDETSVNFLDGLGVLAFKVASGEITNWPLLEHIASKGKPILLSTGMSYLSEVDEAVRVLEGAGCSELALLQCTSNYPAEPSDVNLRAIRSLAHAFQVPVGFSDHTLGIEIAIAAVALGACIVEKHFTLDKSLPGPDHQASLQPVELKAMVQGIRKVEAAKGNGLKRPATSERNMRDITRRCIVARKMILAGTRLTTDMLTFKRPGTGIPPTQLSLVLGRRAVRTLPPDTLLRKEDLQ